MMTRYLFLMTYSIKTCFSQRGLCAGDFNYVVDLQMDRTYRRNVSHILTTHSYTVLRNLFKKYSFIDCWRHLNPTSKDYMYYSSKYNIYTRIDYCLMLKSEIHKIRASDIGL